jgi:hypothetical protein
MSAMIDIPILSRGRVIMPGHDDSVVFGGRAGASFRAPDPHKHVHDLTLGSAHRLLDLQETPIDEIIELLAKLGPLLTIEANPYLRQAFELGLEAGGLTEPVLREVFDQVPPLFDRRRLDAEIDRTVGKTYLDGWVEQGRPGKSRRRVRAFGTRQLHIPAGNAPIVAAVTVIRAALTKSDCLIKSPSNDPLTANAIVRTLIGLAPDHPVTKHLAVAYWKGGDDVMERQIIRVSRIDKIMAWGGMASMQHIQKYLAPGLDLIALNPKHSISILGKEALQSDAEMREAAAGLALTVGNLNQTACACTRVAYVECGTDEASLQRLIRLGEAVYDAIQALPPKLSTPASRPNAPLQAELDAIESEDEYYWVKGDTVAGGVIVSRFEDKVDFADDLNNRIVNLVPVADPFAVLDRCDHMTQSVPVYPESLRERMRDMLAVCGVQRISPMITRREANWWGDVEETAGLPHDGLELERRMVRWVIDQSSGPMSPASSQPVPALALPDCDVAAVEY